LTCDGATENNCLTCEDPLWYMKSLKTCVDDCGDMKYEESSTQSCENCHTTCGCCEEGPGADQCTCCSTGTYLYDGSCGSCPSGYWPNDATNTCDPCDGTCLECTAGTNYDCTLCDLSNGWYLQDDGQCVKPCASTHYGDVSTGKCKNCDPSCETCTDKYEYSCTSCPAGKYLHNGYCVSVCPDGYYEDDSTGMC